MLSRWISPISLGQLPAFGYATNRCGQWLMLVDSEQQSPLLSDSWAWSSRIFQPCPDGPTSWWYLLDGCSQDGWCTLSADWLYMLLVRNMTSSRETNQQQGGYPCLCICSCFPKDFAHVGMLIMIVGCSTHIDIISQYYATINHDWLPIVYFINQCWSCISKPN